MRPPRFFSALRERRRINNIILVFIPASSLLGPPMFLMVFTSCDRKCTLLSFGVRQFAGNSLIRQALFFCSGQLIQAEIIVVISWGCRRIVVTIAGAEEVISHPLVLLGQQFLKVAHVIDYIALAKPQYKYSRSCQ